MSKSAITPRSSDFAKWYQDVIRQADLAEVAEVVKGAMVIKPHGYALWEHIQSDLDRRFKETGHKNAYFPLFIPESFLKKEAEHVEGFSPELAVVTIAGGKKLEEALVVRPTSETIIGHFFAKWIESWRDLPLLINQWANVVRWELRTRLFLRTTEFLWQEGHTAHASHQEALEETLRMLDVYADFSETMMAIPVIKGVKTQAEKFAGARCSYAIEAMMQNGLALQMGTSHDLGQNFGKAFNVRFQNRDKEVEYVWQTSWGVSTRLVGGLIMSHSDDRGLVLPPNVAPIQVVVIPIYRNDQERTQILQRATQLRQMFQAEGIRVEVDDREGYKPGHKYFHWEQRGVPIRLELGPRDLAAGTLMLKSRQADNKETIAFDGIVTRIKDRLVTIQQGLLQSARKRLRDHTRCAETFDEVRDALADASAESGGGQFVMAYLKDDPTCDAEIKALKASVRCIPLDDHYDGPGKCIVTGEEVPQRVVIAKAY